MKDTFTNLDKLVTKHQKRVYFWLDKLTFFYIFCLWMGIIILFGISYYFFSTTSSHLLYAKTEQPVVSLVDHIYFSFITATSTGFGDIIPRGSHKIISIFEVVFGLLLLAVVTSKFVAIKQNIVLTQLYEISVHERLNSIRSSLLLFRQKLNLLSESIEEKSLRRREVEEFFIHLSSLNDTLEILLVLLQRNQNEFVDFKPVDLELIFHSINQSLDRLLEFIRLLNRNNLDWKKENIVRAIKRGLNVNQNLWELLNKYPLNLQTISQQSKVISDQLEAELNL